MSLLSYSTSLLCRLLSPLSLFNAPPTTEIYTLSLHDALPIYEPIRRDGVDDARLRVPRAAPHHPDDVPVCVEYRSEEHTSELQSLTNLVCRLLLEKKKKKKIRKRHNNNEHIARQTQTTTQQRQ